MQSPRVLMVLDHSFPPDIRVENEALSLTDAGFEVCVLAIAPDTRPELDSHRGIRVVRDRLPAWPRNKMRGLAGTVPVLTWYLARRISEVYERWRFDVLHVHDLYLFGGGLRAARRLDVPIVGDLHENWVEALQRYAWSTRFPGKLVISIPRWKRVERRWVNAVDRLVVVVDEARRRNEALGVPSDRITVVPNTIRREEFDRYEVDAHLVARLKSPLTVTYTGGFDVHRGLSSVLEAMPRVLEAQPAARLVLVGEGRIRAELEDEVTALDLEDSVWFEGWQPQPLLKSYIRGSDICLVPHLRTTHTDATLPHKLFHYMYLERPVVVSDCAPLERIVEETGAGRVYRAGDARALADAILDLAEQPQQRMQMGARGRKAVLEKYNWDATVQGLIDLHRELAAD